MLTHTGIEMLPGGDAAPSPTDLAVQMGRICQFAGSVWFTLLAHSVFVAELLAEELGIEQSQDVPEAHLETWAWALLHDAHEVVTSDVQHGWKTDDMRELQGELDHRLQSRYAIDVDMVNFALVKKADRRALEVQALLLRLPRYGALVPGARPPTPREEFIFHAVNLGPMNEPDQCLLCPSPLLGFMGRAFVLLEKGERQSVYDMVHRLARHGVNAWEE